MKFSKLTGGDSDSSDGAARVRSRPVGPATEKKASSRTGKSKKGEVKLLKITSLSNGESTGDNTSQDRLNRQSSPAVKKKEMSLLQVSKVTSSSADAEGRSRRGLASPPAVSQVEAREDSPNDTWEYNSMKSIFHTSFEASKVIRMEQTSQPRYKRNTLESVLCELQKNMNTLPEIEGSKFNHIRAMT